MKVIGLVQGSKETAVPLYVGKDTVYVHTNIEEVKDQDGNSLWQYHEEQYNKEEYIKMMSEQGDETSALVDVVLGVSTSENTNKQFIAQQNNRAIQIFAQGLNLDDESAMEIADLYPAYESKPQTSWKIDEIFRYGLNQWNETQLYKVLEVVPVGQEHNTPDKLPRYFKAIGFSDDGYPVWTQPLGDFDAYEIGDIVWHKDELWICTQGNASGKNTWEPGVYGWQKKAA